MLPSDQIFLCRTHTHSLSLTHLAKCSRRGATASLISVNPQIIGAKTVLAGIGENREKQEVKEVEGMSAVTKLKQVVMSCRSVKESHYK